MQQRVEILFDLPNQTRRVARFLQQQNLGNVVAQTAARRLKRDIFLPFGI
jgi:hypothetical protein